MSAVEQRICDRHLLKLLRSFLRAGVMENGSVRRGDTGTPQGGVISPLLANVYLHALDRQWKDWGGGVLVRYCDDVVVMCRSRFEAKRSLDALRSILGGLDLVLNETKTGVLLLREGAEGLNFLGFTHRWVRARHPKQRYIQFLARWPTRQAMQRAR